MPQSVTDTTTMDGRRQTPGGSPGRRSSSLDRTTIVVGGAVVLGALSTLFISAVPFIAFAYRSPLLQVTIETAAVIVASVAAVLLFGRAGRTGLLGDVLLTGAMVLLAASNGLFSLLPALLGEGGGPVATWGGVGGRTLGALLFLAAAFAPGRTLGDPAGALTRTIAWCLAALAAVALSAVAVTPWLPSGVDPSLSPETAGRPRVVGHPAVLIAQLLLLGIHAAAAAGFSRLARERRDELLMWLAAGSVLLAFARLTFFLFPSLYSPWLHAGDFLRLGGYIAILTGIGREVAEYQRRLTGLAVLEERRRVARDLHDGVTQELYYLKQQGGLLVQRDGEDQVARRVAAAADRALEESRATLVALSRPVDEPLATTLTTAARLVAERSGAQVEMLADEGIEVPPEARESLARIVREATSNAVRHGGARHISLELCGGAEIRLELRDDGSGFDATAPARQDAFGLESMRERARALGGRCEVRSTPGQGTVVDVRLASASEHGDVSLS